MAMNCIKHKGAVLFAALPALLLAGCATSIPPVEVTRFHEGAVARQGSVVVVPADSGAVASLEFRTVANAVAASLTRAGFAVRESGPADYEAVVAFARETYQPGERPSPVNVGVGGSTGSYGSGVGVGIGINLSGRPKPIVATHMRVQLRRAGAQAVFWEGRAEMAAKSTAPAAQPGIAAGQLADALFRDFPGQSGETITVR